MRHVLSMLVTAMLVWCGLVQPAHAAVAMPLASVTTAYTHDSNDSPCLVTDRFGVRRRLPMTAPPTTPLLT